jgi:hypothetical protein
LENADIPLEDTSEAWLSRKTGDITEGLKAVHAWMRDEWAYLF